MCLFLSLVVIYPPKADAVRPYFGVIALFIAGHQIMVQSSPEIKQLSNSVSIGCDEAFPCCT